MGKTLRRRSKQDLVTPRIRGNRGRRLYSKHIASFVLFVCLFDVSLGNSWLRGGAVGKIMSLVLSEPFSIWISALLEVEGRM